MKKDYYDILGVPKSATKDEVKKAFRTLAHKYHPDKTGGDEAKFKEVNEAYSVLSDDSKRKQYDTFGHAQQGGGSQGFGGFDFSGFGGQGFDFDIGDIFGEMFGGGQQQQSHRGRDLSIEITIPFKEAVFGNTRTIVLTKTSQCGTCHGTGGKQGTGTVTCDSCNGKGKINETRKTFFGTFNQTSTCKTCKGKGQIPKEKCTVCKGNGVVRKESELEIAIPAGIDDGEMIRLSGAGEAVFGGTSGDLYIKVQVEADKRFSRKDNHLFTEVPVKLTHALLGGTISVESLDGKVNVDIPAGSKHQDTIRVKGKGIPYSKHERGDMYVILEVQYPKKLSKDQEKLVKELKEQGL